MGRSIQTTLHYKMRADNPVTLTYFCAPHLQFLELYNKIWSKLGLLAPKHALGGFHAQ